MSMNLKSVSNDHYTRKPGRRGKTLTLERAFEIDNTMGTDEELAEKFQCSIATVKKSHDLADLWRSALKYQQWH